MAPDGYLMSADVNAEGGPFLIAAPVASGAAPPFHVVVNWTELLKR